MGTGIFSNDVRCFKMVAQVSYTSLYKYVVGWAISGRTKLMVDVFSVSAAC